MKPKIGDKIETWFSDQPNGMSIVMAVRPYTTATTRTWQKYPNMFSWIVTVTAPRTNEGTLELCI